MFESPDQEWRHLTDHYAEMWDEELFALAADYKDLTEMAKQVLRDEMKKRGLGDPTAPPKETAPVARTGTVKPEDARVSQRDPDVSPEEMLRLSSHYRELCDEDLLDLAEECQDLTPAAQRILRDEMKTRGLGEPMDLESYEDAGEPPALALANAKMRAAIEARTMEQYGDHPREYTCKVPLTDYEDREVATQRVAMLMREGIQCWYVDPSQHSGDPTVARLDYRIFVPADQLEEAQRILAQPVPQDIIDESKVEVPEFVMPQCPKCGSTEPTLVATDPSNTWQCESCGNEWADPVPEPEKA